MRGKPSLFQVFSRNCEGLNAISKINLRHSLDFADLPKVYSFGDCLIGLVCFLVLLWEGRAPFR